MNIDYSVVERAGVRYWPGAELLATEEEEEVEEDEVDETDDEEADWLSCLLWDARNDCPASCLDL